MALTNGTVEVALPDGTSMMVEVGPSTGPRDVGFESVLNFDLVFPAIEQLAQLAVGAVKSAAPDEAEIELLVGLDASSGKLLALLVDGKAEASLKVRLLWKREAAPR